MPARAGTSSSSMYTTASYSSSVLNSSPSRQSPNRNGGRPHRASLVRDPYTSPSRQMHVEFNLRLSISDRDFNEKLDQAAAERSKLHAHQLAQAAEEHQRILRAAEVEVQRITLEDERARLKKEEDAKREVERLRLVKAHEEAEAQRKALAAKQHEEETARQNAEQQRKLQESQARVKAHQEQAAAAEKQKSDKAEADRKAAEVAARAQAQQVAQQPVPTPTPSTSSPASTSDVEQLHTQYLQLHTRMKEFRKAFATEHKEKSSPLKALVGDFRRDVRLRLGQITFDRKASVAAIKRLRENDFDKALTTPGPMIDIRPFIITHAIPPLANEAEAQYPALLLYVWICFEKSLLKQFEKEASDQEARNIQEMGLVAASLLSDPKYMWRGIPLSDIVLAKFHKLCPLLFGIRGNMKSVGGMARLGWLPIDKGPPDVESIAQRMRGLGAGYAAMSLRVVSGKIPAIAMSEYWRAVVSICNTPSDELWPGHFAVLAGLLRNYYKKFLTHFGVPARAVLRRAVIDLPARAPPRCTDAASSVSVLATSWKKENFSLE